MCGFCGYISRTELSDKALEEMNNKMQLRGPDDSGVWQCNYLDKYIGLAHKRLSILDLSLHGHQPMISSDGNLVIVYNGEIYNCFELRRTLESFGYTFKSHCDTEVVMYAYKHWGEEMLSRLNGMFSFSIFNKKENIVFLARDRFGEKPLYYYHKNDDFIFSSTLSSIIHCELFEKEINQDAIHSFLVRKAIYSPLTIFKNTFKLPPAHFAIIKNDQISIQCYWSVPKIYMNNSSKENIISNFEEAKQRLAKSIKESTKNRMIADVPVGVFLSGGIDSSLVAAFANECSDKPINTFTIGFKDSKYDEAPQAAKIAQHIGTNHNELYVSQDDILSLVQQIPKHYDEPFSDASQIPTLLLSRFAKQKVSVALGGDGGDELFCGYSNYDWAFAAQRIQPFADLINKINTSILPSKISLEKVLPPKAMALIQNQEKAYRVQCFETLKKRVSAGILKHPKELQKLPQEKEILSNNWQIRRMLLDMQTYLPDEVLCKVDRASMAHSLEVRTPFLDHHLAELSFSIPHNFKYHYGNKKYILKQIAYDKIPRKLLDMPKRGFGVPISDWLNTVLNEKLQYYCRPEAIEKQGIFCSDGLNNLITIVRTQNSSIYSTVLWGVFVFQMWYEEYIEDVFSEYN